MRSHADIVRGYGAAAIYRDLTARGVEIHQSTPQRWAERSSIPGEYWKSLVELGAATLDELADAADRQSRRTVAGEGVPCA